MEPGALVAGCLPTSPGAFRASAKKKRSVRRSGGGRRSRRRAGNAQSVQTDTMPADYKGAPVLEPGPDKTAGPVAPGRGSEVAGKVAVVTGAARGNCRAIDFELAAIGADESGLASAR